MVRKLTNSNRFNTWFERAYIIGVIIKGIDGAIELIAGLALLVSPRLLHMLLSGIVGEAGGHHSHVFHFIAQYVARLDTDLARSGLVFLIIFLIGHGLVKLVLVYCLLRRIVHAYPYALVVLFGFLLYQIYVVILDPLSIGMWLFTILDVVIIWLVWGEYQELREKNDIITDDAKDNTVLQIHADQRSDEPEIVAKNIGRKPQLARPDAHKPTRHKRHSGR